MIVGEAEGVAAGEAVGDTAAVGVTDGLDAAAVGVTDGFGVTDGAMKIGSPAFVRVSGPNRIP